MSFAAIAVVVLVVLLYLAALMGGALTANKVKADATGAMQFTLLLCLVVALFSLLAQALPVLLGATLIGAFAVGYVNHKVEAAKKNKDSGK